MSVEPLFGPLVPVRRIAQECDNKADPLQTARRLFHPVFRREGSRSCYNAKTLADHLNTRRPDGEEEEEPSWVLPARTLPVSEEKLSSRDLDEIFTMAGKKDLSLDEDNYTWDGKDGDHWASMKRVQTISNDFIGGRIDAETVVQLVKEEYAELCDIVERVAQVKTTREGVMLLLEKAQSVHVPERLRDTPLHELAFNTSLAKGNGELARSLHLRYGCKLTRDHMQRSASVEGLVTFLRPKKAGESDGAAETERNEISHIITTLRAPKGTAAEAALMCRLVGRDDILSVLFPDGFGWQDVPVRTYVDADMDLIRQVPGFGTDVEKVVYMLKKGENDLAATYAHAHGYPMVAKKIEEWAKNRR